MLNRRSLLAAFTLCPACAAVAKADNVHWSYEGSDGPENWGSLEKDFQVCSLGTQQSPVDLQGTVRAESSGPKLAWKSAPFKVTNNGHTIQLDATTDASTAEIKGKSYILRQFHFHTPSEHALDGKRTAMEAHFVHAADDGTLLVVGLFMVPEGKNDAFSAVMAAAPQREGSAAQPSTIDPSAFLPQARGLYRYEGSLTTPPCSEVVDWNVFATPIAVAEKDIETFRTIFPMNARPLQEVNRRFLLRLD